MLAAGDPVPEVTLFRAPGQPVTVRELVADGPVLLLFYLFDWSST
jgi:peroxiredoxin